MDIVLTFERFHQLIILARKHFEPQDPVTALDRAIENELVGACAGFSRETAGEHARLLDELRLAQRVHGIMRMHRRIGLYTDDPRASFARAQEIVHASLRHAEDAGDPLVTAFYARPIAEEEPVS